MAAPAHVRAGGSKIHRILACPASLQLEEAAGPDSSGPDARLGTAAHALLEKVLRLGTDGGAAAWIGTPFIVEGQTFVVDGEMAEAVQVAVDWVNNILATCPDAIVRLEQRVDWAPLKPPEPMRGSADIIIWVPSLRLLLVADYKHGKGKVVEVRGNAQGRFYAVGALAGNDARPIAIDDVEKVQVTIIQPRAWHADGPVRSETISTTELWMWATLAKEAVRVGGLPNAPAKAGDHCTFCRAAPTCETKAQASLALAQEEFSMPAKVMDPAEVAAKLLQLEPLLDAAMGWAKEARAFLHARAAGGEAVPGFKLVPTRPMRVWNNLDEVKVFAELEGLGVDEYAPRELVSPAQMEKLCGKKTLPKSLYSSVSSGLNLVHEAAEGTAVARIGAADEFSIVETGEAND